jgi:hypothetical protein
MTIVSAACCRKDGGELLRPESESLLGFDQAGCFWAAGTGGFKPASRASLSARNRAVFSRVADCAASYSAIACCPSRSCCSFFLKAASARSRAGLASVSNLVTPVRANRAQDRLSCLRTGCRLSMWDAQPSQRCPRLFVPCAPRAGAGVCLDAPARIKASAAQETVRNWIVHFEPIRRAPGAVG